MFMFLDRSHKEGEEYLLYAFPTRSAAARALIPMRSVLSCLEGAVSAVSGQQVHTAELDLQPDTPGYEKSRRITICTVEVSIPAPTFFCARRRHSRSPFKYLPQLGEKEATDSTLCFVMCSWGAPNASLPQLAHTILSTAACVAGPLTRTCSPVSPSTSPT